jgi:hypothetical protein
VKSDVKSDQKKHLNVSLLLLVSQTHSFIFPRKTHGHELAGGTSLLDVAIAMSLLLAQVGEAPRQLITFSEEPRLVTLPDTEDLTELYRFVQGLDWGYTTNFHKAEYG